MKFLFFAATCLAAALAATPAAAAPLVMTFDNLAVGFSSWAYTYIESGISFSQPAGYMSGAASGGNPGAYFAGPNYVNAHLILSLDGGGLFDLASIDLRIYGNSQPISQTFVGTLASGGTVTATKTAPADLSWVTATFDSSWSGLQKVEWNYNLVLLDNITVNPVAEPASAAILSLGLFALAARRRRR